MSTTLKDAQARLLGQRRRDVAANMSLFWRLRMQDLRLHAQFTNDHIATLEKEPDGAIQYDTEIKALYAVVRHLDKAIAKLQLSLDEIGG